MLKSLWFDEAGAILSFEFMLLLVILVIGISIGMVILRDAIVSEFQLVAAAVNSLDPGYGWAGLVYTGTSSGAYVNGSQDVGPAAEGGTGLILDVVVGTAPEALPIVVTPPVISP
jgi:hypothetical protein